MDKFKPGIYKIQHKTSGKFYVGSAKKISRRWIEHVRDLRAQKHFSPKLQKAWNKYGQDAFEFSILEIVEDVHKLLEREQFWLDATQAVKHGYNSAKTAGSLLGFKHTEETKEKMKQAALGHIKSEEHRKNLSIVNTGKKMSAEAREKMRLAKLGKKRPPHTEETKALMSAVKMGKTATDEAKAKMSLAKMGRKLSEETKRRMSIAHQKRLQKS
jgi:group I intron endonuclease